MAIFKLLKSLPELARYGHAGVVFNNRIIIAGGYSGSAYLNDVWETVDGINWNRLATGANSFSIRAYHKMVVHDNCLYVIGGTNGSDLADVWMSRDGTKWDRVTSDGGFVARDEFALWSINGFLYLCGGTTGATYPTDMWRSRDGVTWNRVNTGYSRNNRRFAASLVYDNKMWLLGGATDASTATDDSMWSVEGQEWRDGDMTAYFGPLIAAGACVFDNKMVLVGGNKSDVDTAADIVRTLFYSYTGTEWYLGSSDVGFALQHPVALALKNPNRMFVLFGWDGTSSSGNIWQSEGVEFKDNILSTGW